MESDIKEIKKAFDIIEKNLGNLPANIEDKILEMLNEIKYEMNLSED